MTFGISSTSEEVGPWQSIRCARCRWMRRRRLLPRSIRARRTTSALPGARKHSMPPQRNTSERHEGAREHSVMKHPRWRRACVSPSAACSWRPWGSWPGPGQAREHGGHGTPEGWKFSWPAGNCRPMGRNPHTAQARPPVDTGAPGATGCQAARRRSIDAISSHPWEPEAGWPPPPVEDVRAFQPRPGAEMVSLRGSTGQPRDALLTTPTGILSCPRRNPSGVLRGFRDIARPHRERSLHQATPPGTLTHPSRKCYRSK